MAIFHHSTQVIGRSKGRSSVAAAAYRLGIALEDERTGMTYDYTRKGGVDSWHTLAPENAPEWVNDPGRLFNEIEKCEIRKDAQLCREVNIALPAELTQDQMKALAIDYAKEQWVDKGMVAVVAFHDLDGGNPHCHVLLTMRELGPEGFGKKAREWNDKQLTTDYREAWATKTNEALAEHGHASRIDHRSLEAQGIDRAPTQHQGPIASAMEKRGAEPERKRVREMEVPLSMDHAQALEDQKREQEQTRAKEPDQAKTLAKAQAEEMVEAIEAVHIAKINENEIGAKGAKLGAMHTKATSRINEELEQKRLAVKSATKHGEAATKAAGEVEEWDKTWLSKVWTPKRIEEAAGVAEWEANKAAERSKQAAAHDRRAGKLETLAGKVDTAQQKWPKQFEEAKAERKEAMDYVKNLAIKHQQERETPQEREERLRKEREQREQREREKAQEQEWARPMQIPSPDARRHQTPTQQPTQTQKKGRGWTMGM